MQYCTFTMDDMTFGVEVERVQEAIRFQAMTPVPLAPPVVGGLVNLRGQIVTAVDLRHRLGLSERSGTVAPMNLVVHTGEGVVSLLVDQVGDVVEVGDTAPEPVPDTVTAPGSELIVGAHQLSEGLLLVLDTEAATTTLPRSA